MKKPAASSSKEDEDDETLVRRHAQRAEEAMQTFARELRLGSAVSCAFTHFEKGEGGMIACFSWVMVRPHEKQHLFDHERLEDKTKKPRVADLRKTDRFVPEPEGWRMQLRWEQFLVVATDAAERATKKLGVPIGCAYVGVRVHHGRAGGPPSYEPNPAKWPNTALQHGRATHADIFFRFFAELPDGERGMRFIPIRADNLKNQQLSLPERDICETTVVRKRPRLMPGGTCHSVYIRAQHVADYDQAFPKWYAAVQERHVSQETRLQEFQLLVQEWTRGVTPSWFHVMEYLREKNLQAKFLTNEEHEELCRCHVAVFGEDGREHGSERAPLRVLWASWLDAFAEKVPQSTEHIKSRPRSLLLRTYPWTDDKRGGPGLWKTWHRSYSDFVRDHIARQDYRDVHVRVRNDLAVEDFRAFGALVGCPYVGVVDEAASLHRCYWVPGPVYPEYPNMIFDNSSLPSVPCTQPVEEGSCYWLLPVDGRRHDQLNIGWLPGEDQMRLSLKQWYGRRHDQLSIGWLPGEDHVRLSLKQWCGLVGAVARDMFDPKGQHSASPEVSLNYLAFFEIGGTTTSHCASRRAEFLQKVLAVAEKHGLRKGCQLFDPALDGNAAAVRRILDDAAHPDVQDFNGDTALHLAACYDSLQVLRTLCEARANTNIMNAHGRTALASACWNSHADTATAVAIDILCEHRADPNAKVHCTTTWLPDPLLRVAIAWCHLDVVHALCRHGADPNIEDRMGNSALHGAVRTGDVEMLRLLTLDDIGADTEKTDSQGRTPVELAADRSDLPAVNILYHAGASLAGLRTRADYTDYVYLEGLERGRDSETRQSFTRDVALLFDDSRRQTVFGQQLVRSHVSS